ncbi:MAG: hypothetical protein J5608_01160 [Alphaproteobacteria bacterium]|nr:hypothetical protein [Alphaproteobacteria bacterium]
MKKLALSSLIAVFAVSGAHAANVIDGNPLYMPKANHFYSVTDLSSHSETTKDLTLTEDFGYGITDRLAVEVSTALYEGAEDPGDDEMFDVYGMGNVSLKATFRALDLGAWKVDAYGKYASEGATIFAHSDGADDTFWFDKDLINYRWTAGVRGGYTTSLFTVAGHVEFDYLNTESFNWNDEGLHTWTVGVDGQFVIDENWNLVAGVEYKGRTDDGLKNAGTWAGMAGVNYNIDATKFVGAYVKADMKHWKDNGEKGWELNDGFGYGVRFGIDF